MDLVYENSILGGTFDHLHLGHLKLIDTAFEMSDHVTIGLTQPSMYKNKFLADKIESYEIREKNLKQYLLQKNYIRKTTIIPISDIYGTTLKDKKIDAIFATEENLQNLILINKKREEIGFPPLHTFIVPYLKAKDGKNITSERIRKGEIDRDGFVYKNIFDKQNELILPESLRPILQKPLGEVVKNVKDLLKMLNEKDIVIAVGDVIYEELKKEEIHPAVGIVDFKTRREPFISKFLKRNFFILKRNVTNKQGTINRKAVNAYKIALDKYLVNKKPETVIVSGEEDLLALPAILLAPLGSVVLYGQFDKGIVMNVVSEEFKKRIKDILEKFK